MVRIAWKKAGSAKKNVPLLTQKYRDDVTQIIAEPSDKVGVMGDVGRPPVGGEVFDLAICGGTHVASMRSARVARVFGL